MNNLSFVVVFLASWSNSGAEVHKSSGLAIHWWMRTTLQSCPIFRFVKFLLLFLLLYLERSWIYIRACNAKGHGVRKSPMSPRPIITLYNLTSDVF